MALEPRTQRRSSKERGAWSLGRTAAIGRLTTDVAMLF